MGQSVAAALLSRTMPRLPRPRHAVWCLWMRRVPGLLFCLVLIGVGGGCVGAPPSTGPTRATSSPLASGQPTASADWPPLPTRSDAPAGVALTGHGETVKLSNNGPTGFWWPYRIDGWSGPPWRSVRPSEGQEYLNALAPGDTYTWTFDARPTRSPRSTSC